MLPVTSAPSDRARNHACLVQALPRPRSARNIWQFSASRPRLHPLTSPECRLHSMPARRSAHGKGRGALKAEARDETRICIASLVVPMPLERSLFEDRFCPRVKLERASCPATLLLPFIRSAIMDVPSPLSLATLKPGPRPPDILRGPYGISPSAKSSCQFRKQSGTPGNPATFMRPPSFVTPFRTAWMRFPVASLHFRTCQGLPGLSGQRKPVSAAPRPAGFLQGVHVPPRNGRDDSVRHFHVA